MKSANDLVARLKATRGKAKNAGISLTEDQIQWLEHIATRSGEGVTKSDVVRTLIDEKRASEEAIPA